MTGSSENIYRHLEAGGRTAANEYDANYDYSQVTDTFDDEKESWPYLIWKKMFLKKALYKKTLWGE